MNILIIGGTWDEKQGMPSSTIKNLKRIIQELYPTYNLTVFNGGNIADIQKTKSDKYDYIFWLANVNKEWEHLEKTKLITYKRNDKLKYSFEDLINNMKNQNAYLSFEFVKQKVKVKKKHYHKFFNIKLFDSNGNILYEGEHLKEAVPLVFK